MSSSPQKVTGNQVKQKVSVVYFCNSHLFKVSIYYKSNVSMKHIEQLSLYQSWGAVYLKYCTTRL